jgi:hypothetical protein
MSYESFGAAVLAFRRILYAGVLIAAAAVSPVASASGPYVGATITLIQTPTPTANCFYFMLAGVGEADPVAPGNAWFAVSSTQNGFTQLYAMVIAAKLAGNPVTVVTTGALAGGTCGTFAGVDHVALD